MTGPPGPRRGATLPEILVAFGIFGLVSFGGWSAFRLVRRQAAQVREYSDVVQTASSLLARLELDAAAMTLPDGTPRSVVVEDEGRVLRFFRTGQAGDPDTQPAGELGLYSVRYELRDGEVAGLTLTRTAERVEPEIQTWDGFPIQDARFSTEDFRGAPYIFLELLFRDPAAGTDAGGKKATLPLRWMHQIPAYESLRTRGPVPGIFRGDALPPAAPAGPTHTIELEE